MPADDRKPAAKDVGSRPTWRAWLQVGAMALLLLVLSETLWLWQTWPVRELLQVPSGTGVQR
jgi:hypothetical protein